MSDERENPWASPAIDEQIELTRQRPLYDLSGYQAEPEALASDPASVPVPPAPVPPTPVPPAPVPQQQAYQPYGTQPYAPQPYGTQQFPAQQPYPMGVPPVPYPPAAPLPRKESGFGKLFDFEFKTPLTPAAAKVVYILAIVGAVVQWLGGVLGGVISPFRNGSILTTLGDLVLGGVAALLFIVLVRFFLDLVLSAGRAAERADEIAAKLTEEATPEDDEQGQ